MKKAIIIIIVLVILLGSLFLGKNIIIENYLSDWCKAITGLKITAEKVDIGISNTLVDIKNLKIYNPPGFHDKLMADIPEVYVDYDTMAFIKGQVHLEELRLNLREFVVEKTKDGKINVHSLKIIRTEEDKKSSKNKKKSKMDNMRIDKLELKIGGVIFKDYSKGLPPNITKYNLNINERFANIDNGYDFVSLVISRAFNKASMANLIDFDVKSIKDGANKISEKASSAAEQIKMETLKVGKDMKKEAGEAILETKEKIESAIKKILHPKGE